MLTAAQRTLNPYGVGATPAGSTNSPAVTEDGRERSLLTPSDLSRGFIFIHDVPEQPRDQPAKLRVAGASPAVVSTLGP